MLPLVQLKWGDFSKCSTCFTVDLKFKISERTNISPSHSLSKIKSNKKNLIKTKWYKVKHHSLSIQDNHLRSRMILTSLGMEESGCGFEPKILKGILRKGNFPRESNRSLKKT